MSAVSPISTLGRGEGQEQRGARTIVAEVPVVEVSLLEDRALVFRRGVVELPPGRVRVVIDAVAPVLVDKTLSASVAAVAGAELPEGLKVRTLHVERQRVTSEAERPTDVASVREQIREQQREVEAEVLHRNRIETELAALQQLIELTIGEFNEDVGWGRQDRARWTEQLEQLEARLRELSLERRCIDHGIEQLQVVLKDLRSLLSAGSRLDAVAKARVVIELVNPGSVGRAVELRVDYLVPGAMWRPWHTAKLHEDERGVQLSFRCDGAVWQATGEDWRDVQLIFSTERPSLGVSPPALADDELRVRRRGASVEVQAREQKIHTAGLGAETQREADDELPGIDDGGAVQQLRAAVKATIPGDGRPHRVPIFRFEAPAEVALVCVPELAPAVLLRSRQANLASAPLLAGPVDLIRNSGLVGRTSLLYVAPGERFDLGWGPDSSLRVRRTVEHLDPERRMMSAWTRKPRKVSIKLSNLSATAKTIEIRERIAVSEIEKVQVELIEASRGAVPDDEGFVSWNLALRGFGHEQLELHWVLVVHDDVVGL